MMFSVIDVILALLLLIVPAAAIYLLDRPRLRPAAIAVARMMGQMALMGLVLWTFFRFHGAWLLLLWLVVLSAGSAYLVVRRSKQVVRRMLLPVSAGLFLANLIVALWLLTVLFSWREVWSARYFLPLTALLSAHSVTMLIRSLSVFEQARQQDNLQYEFNVSNGFTHWRALLPFVRQAFQHLLSPSLTNISAMGLYSMPLLLVGLLLGGWQPVQAVILCVLLVVACLAASVIALLFAIWLAYRK